MKGERLVIGVIVMIFAAVVGAALVFNDGKNAELLRAAGVDLRLPNATILGMTGPGTSVFGAGTEITVDYGTDASLAEIGAFFDAELKKRGYLNMAIQESPPKSGGGLIAEYKNGGTTYSIYTHSLPYKYGSRVITTGYAHILTTKISNRPNDIK